MRQGLNKNIVLQAAAELADQEGFEKVTLAAIAKKLNIRTPSLYNHIEGFSGLKKDLALYALHKLKNNMAEAAIGRSGEEALYSIGISYVSFVRKHPGLYEAANASFDPLDPQLQEAGNEIVTLLLRILGSYKLDQETALHVVRGLRSLVHGFASLELREGFNLELNTDESLSYLLNTYLAGLKTTYDQS